MTYKFNIYLIIDYFLGLDAEESYLTFHKFKHLMKDQLDNQHEDDDTVLSKEQIDGKKFSTKQAPPSQSFFQLSNVDILG